MVKILYLGSINSFKIHVYTYLSLIVQGFRPCPTQTGLYNHTRWLEAGNFGSRKKRECTIRVAKTKALIRFAVTAKLICVFVFAYAKSRFSHDVAHLRGSKHVLVTRKYTTLTPVRFDKPLVHAMFLKGRNFTVLRQLKLVIISNQSICCQ